MIDILVLNYNDSDTVIKYIEKVKSYKNVRKLLVVDNCSKDNSVEKIKEYTSDKIELIISDKNGGYGYGNNYGIRYLVDKYDSEYILLSNPDIIVDEQTIEKMEIFLRKNDDYAIVAPYMLDINGKKQFNTAFKLPSKMEYIISLGLLAKKIKTFYYNDLEKEKNVYKQVDAVSGSMFLMDSKKMIKFGMYDEKIFLYCEEVVLGIKMKENKQKIALLLQESFIHNHSVSISKTYKSELSKNKLLVKSKLYVIKKYYKANIIEYFFANILGKISNIEIFILGILRWKKR